MPAEACCLLVFILLLGLICSTSALDNSLHAILLRRALSLHPRQDSCVNPGSQPCNINGLCCQTSTECIPLERNTSVICCDVDDICNEIRPTACTLPTSNKQTPVQPQETCGTDKSKCCPLGFTCDVGGLKCVMKPENYPQKYKDKLQKGNITDTLAAQKSSTGYPPSTPDCIFSCPRFPPKAIITGLLPGIVLGIALLFGYTKFSEMRTRRRSIQSFGPMLDRYSFSAAAVAAHSNTQNNSISNTQGPLDHDKPPVPLKRARQLKAIVPPPLPPLPPLKASRDFPRQLKPVEGPVAMEREPTPVDGHNPEWRIRDRMATTGNITSPGAKSWNLARRSMSDTAYSPSEYSYDGCGGLASGVDPPIAPLQIRSPGGAV
jgi:hypothetical protein